MQNLFSDRAVLMSATYRRSDILLQCDLSKRLKVNYRGRLQLRQSPQNFFEDISICLYHKNSL